MTLISEAAGLPGTLAECQPLGLLARPSLCETHVMAVEMRVPIPVHRPVLPPGPRPPVLVPGAPPAASLC